jgi:hypothetical protein
MLVIVGKRRQKMAKNGKNGLFKVGKSWLKLEEIMSKVCEI